MNDTASNASDMADAGFEKLGLAPNLIAALGRLELDTPTEIQTRMIPAVLEEKDCLACASTGAGKTNAYLLPILQSVTPGAGLQAIVVQPTRSLASQLQRNIRRFAPEAAPRTAVAVGQRPGREQTDPLATAPDVLIATPRGVCEVMRRGAHDWSTVRLLVIDEADAILDDRGPRQLREIHETLAHPHQTVMLAGNLDEPVRTLADELLSEPVEIERAASSPRAVAVQHAYVEVEPAQKFDTFVAFCRQQAPRLAIVFTGGGRRGRDLAERLEHRRISCRWIGAPGRFRERDQRSRRPHRAHSELIIAADPAPRRLSTIPASHLLHYDMPNTVNAYVRRLEQATRLRRTGAVIAFVEPKQRDLLHAIEQRIGKLFERLDLPERPRQRPPAVQAPEASNSNAPDSVGTSGKGSRNGSANSSQEPPGRLSEALYRDEELEARGVQPQPRTLGSRFRSARRGKPLRRPDSTK